MSRRAALPLPWLLLVGGCAPEPFALRSIEAGTPGSGRLDEPLRFTFNDDVDPGSVNAAALRVVRVGDGGEVSGSLAVSGSVVVFTPRLPCEPSRLDGGFLPAERYRLELPGRPRLRTLRGLELGALDRGSSSLFETARLEGGHDALASSPPAALYVDPKPGAPEVASSAATWTSADGGVLTLRFTEPLDPAALRRGRFRLGGPWSLSALAADDPLLKARLIENQSEARVEFTPVEPLQRQPVAGDRCWLELDPAALIDFGGNTLVQSGHVPDRRVPVEFASPDVPTMEAKER